MCCVKYNGDAAEGTRLGKPLYGSSRMRYTLLGSYTKLPWLYQLT